MKNTLFCSIVRPIIKLVNVCKIILPVEMQVKKIVITKKCVYTKFATVKAKKTQLECDFVANLGNEKIYIQSAMNISEEKKKKQEENSLLRINDSFKKIIIQKEKIIPHYDDNGIYITCLEDFLMGKW